jgi:hypothetical protein
LALRANAPASGSHIFTLGGRNAVGSGPAARQSSQSTKGGATAIGVIAVGIVRFAWNWNGTRAN